MQILTQQVWGRVLHSAFLEVMLMLLVHTQNKDLVQHLHFLEKRHRVISKAFALVNDRACLLTDAGSFLLDRGDF